MDIEKLKKTELKQVAVLALFFIICLTYFIVMSDQFLTSYSEGFEYTAYLPQIQATDEYVQEIDCDRDGLKQIRLFLATFNRTNFSNLYVHLTDKKGKEIDSWEVDCSLLKDNTYYPLALDHGIAHSKGKNYLLHITSDAVPGQGITIYTNNEGGKQSGLSLNGKKKKYKICYQLMYKGTIRDMLAGVNGFHISILCLLAVLLFVVIILGRNLAVENRFLAIWVMVGLMFLFSLPPFRTPDEESHFYRAFEISYFNILSEIDERSGAGGRQLPLEGVDISALEESWQSFSDNKNEVVMSDTLQFVGFSNTALYAPISYMPQALGIFLTRIISDKIAVIAYGGRIMNWIFVTVILYLTIKMLPFGKEIMILLLLMPMNVQEAVSLAPDGMVVAVSFFMMAFVLCLKYERTDQLKLHEIVILYILAVIISMMKIVYLPLGMMYFLIPQERFGGMKNKLVNLTLMASVAIGLNLGWMGLTTKFLVIEGTNASVQLDYIIHHMGYFITVLARTVLTRSGLWANEMIGSQLAELNVYPLEIFLLVYLCLLIHKYGKNSQKSSEKDDFTVNTVCGVTVIIIFLLVATSIYLQWNSLYNDVIKGIQGRYFIPLMIPAYLALSKPSNIISGDKQNNLSIYESGFVAMINICSCLTLLFSCIRFDVLNL